jgi:hypothetical protein
MADLANTYSVIRGMRMTIFTKDAFAQLTAVFCLPLLPLIFTIVPASELLRRIAKIIF